MLEPSRVRPPPGPPQGLGWEDEGGGRHWALGVGRWALALRWAQRALRHRVTESGVAVVGFSAPGLGSFDAGQAGQRVLDGLELQAEPFGYFFGA